jgi:type IV secretion system protein VirB5
MYFRRAVQRYGSSGEPETAYSRAGQVWDDRLGSARAQAYNWRRFALGNLLLSAGLASALFWQSLQNRVVPYIVEIDRLGEAQAVRQADAVYQPTDPQIAWHLARFIENVRSVSLDPVLMRRNWLGAYDFATRRGAAFLDDYARHNPPFAHIGEKTSLVQVTSVVRASDRSFQLKWTETLYEQGVETNVSHWTAMATIVTRSPTTSDVLRKNPLGIYVDGLDWSRELEPIVRPKLSATSDQVLPEPPETAPSTATGGSFTHAQETRP